MGKLFAEKKLLVSSGLRNLIYSSVHLAGGREPYFGGWFLGHSPFRQWPFSPQSIGCSVQDQKFAHFCSNVRNSLYMMYSHMAIITNGANSHYLGSKVLILNKSCFDRLTLRFLLRSVEKAQPIITDMKCICCK
jgi:hypothetical protein